MAELVEKNGSNSRSQFRTFNDLLAVRAVISEPVSTRNSLLTGKNTGNFAI